MFNMPANRFRRHLVLYASRICVPFRAISCMQGRPYPLRSRNMGGASADDCDHSSGSTQPLLATSSEPPHAVLICTASRNHEIAGPSQASCSVHNEDPDSVKQCRICFETHDEPNDPLISPCRCAGSSQHIHRHCLRQWRESALQNPRSLAYYRCEVCHFEYKFIRSDAASLLAHPAAVAVAFSVLLFLSTFILGYIPLVQSSLKGAGADAAWHAPTSTWAWVLLHVVNGMLLVGWLGCIAWVVARCTTGSASGACPCSMAGNECNNCYCPGCYMVDCSSLCAGGEACGPVILVVAVVAAVVGLVAVLPYAYAWLYQMVQEGAGATMRMVENVGSAKGPSARQGSSSEAEPAV